MKFGWDGRMFLDHNASLGNPGGNFSFGTTFTCGPDPVLAVPTGQAPYLGFASFLLRIPTGGQITYSDATSQTGYYHALYLQDDWRVTQKLTLNLGIRWEMETGPVERYNRIATSTPIFLLRWRSRRACRFGEDWSFEASMELRAAATKQMRVKTTA